jgi:hypothetical protein
MKKYNHIKFVIGLFALLLIPAKVKAGRDLLIFEVGQAGQNTCWAACAIMVLRSYDRANITSELQIRRWVFDSGGSTDSANALAGGPKTTDMVLKHFSQNYIESYSINTGTVPGCGGEGCISQSMLTSTIDDGRPMIAGVTPVRELGVYSYHAVVIRGYTGSGGSVVGDVIYNEPRYNGRRHMMPYSDFVAGDDWFWDETLMITSKPKADPIPVGIGSNEGVSIYNSTTEITQSPQNLTFRAAKSGPHVPVNWNWKLVFPHDGGEYVAATWSVTTSAFLSTWNVPNFVLPSNYKWKYNFDGKIPGRIEVLVNDNAGPPAHTDAANVLYVPNDLYPGVVIYENKTISSPQPEVKAHELIRLQNSQFLPGSNINFRSGERIEIREGTNINIPNSGSINFTVDPSIR